MQEFIEVSHSLKHKKSSDLCVHNIGYETCRPGYHYGPRICPYHLIHFVTKGSGTLFIHNQEFAVHAGEAFLIPAEQIASYKASVSDPWTYYWIGFLGISCDSFLHSLLSHNHASYVFSLPDTQKYAGLIRPAAQMHEVNMISYYSSNSILLQVMAELSKDVIGPEHSQVPTDLADEIRYTLDMKYSEPLLLSELADQIGIHPNYLTAVFRKRFCVTPKQYLTRLKINKACQLLSASELPIGVISQTLGFEDQMAFSKVFRKEMSVSPTQYRKQAKNLPHSGIDEAMTEYVTYLS